MSVIPCLKLSPTDTGANWELVFRCASVYLCVRVCVRGAVELLWERVAQVARSPGSAEGIGSACGARPTTHNICQGKARERERSGGSVFLTTTWVHRSPVLHHMLSACLSTCLSVSPSLCQQNKVLSMVKLSEPRWWGMWCYWGVVCLSPEHLIHKCTHTLTYIRKRT